MNLEYLENVFVLFICSYLCTNIYVHILCYLFIRLVCSQSIKSLLFLLLIGCMKPYSTYLFLRRYETCRAACYACYTANQTLTFDWLCVITLRAKAKFP